MSVAPIKCGAFLLQAECTFQSGGFVAGQTSLSTKTAHNYGQITVEFEGPRPVNVSEEVLHELLKSIISRVQDRVVPAVEQVVENEGVRIGSKPAHSEANLPLYISEEDLTARIDCEVVPEISEAAMAEVDQILEDEIAQPFKNFLFRRPERSRFRDVSHRKTGSGKRVIKAVRSAFRAFD
jgi:hypothetical protein